MSMPVQPPLIAFSDGPHRWVEIPPVVCRQLSESRGMILQAANQVSPGEAVILGAGLCQEIPLSEMAHRFQGITLNDYEAALLERAVDLAVLGPEDASKILNHVADLTGVSDEFLRQVDGCLTTDHFTVAIDRIAELAEATVPQTFLADRRYELVIASCVLCQLHLRACNGAIERFAATFPDQLQVFRESPRWVQAMYGLARRMEQVFIESLYRMVQPGGRIYLSESVQGCFLYPAPGGRWKTDGMYRMTQTLELSDYLDARFRIESRGKWVWAMAPAMENGEIGRLFKVQGLILSVV